MRLDNVLVSDGFFETRTKAQGAIKDGIIEVNGKLVTKPSFDVPNEYKIKVIGETLSYVSRGGLKLEKAIDVFGIDLAGRTMLDIGSSTGGFTDCALQNNCAHVIAVDVGSDQMAKKLREDDRVSLYENTDFRTLDKDVLDAADFASIDVSFISVTKIIDVFRSLDNLKEVVCLIKPQFECGKEIADKYKGIIKDKNVHRSVIDHVISAFNNVGYYAKGLTVSPIKGGSGNTEYLAHFFKGYDTNFVGTKEIEKITQDAFNADK